MDNVEKSKFISKLSKSVNTENLGESKDSVRLCPGTAAESLSQHGPREVAPRLQKSHLGAREPRVPSLQTQGLAGLNCTDVP